MIFCFDAETDGLYGEVFAIGAIVMDDDGNVKDEFSGVSRAQDVSTPWVIENVLPHIDDMREYENRAALREAFWAFWMRYREDCLCLADVPYPVEAQLMRACVEGDLVRREWLGPFPMIDVASVFTTKGMDPLTDRMAFSGFPGRQHHPLDDAMASSLCYIKLLNSP